MCIWGAEIDVASLLQSVSAVEALKRVMFNPEFSSQILKSVLASVLHCGNPPSSHSNGKTPFEGETQECEEKFWASCSQ